MSRVTTAFSTVEPDKDAGTGEWNVWGVETDGNLCRNLSTEWVEGVNVFRFRGTVYYSVRGYVRGWRFPESKRLSKD